MIIIINIIYIVNFKYEYLKEKNIIIFKWCSSVMIITSRENAIGIYLNYALYQILYQKLDDYYT